MNHDDENDGDDQSSDDSDSTSNSSSSSSTSIPGREMITRARAQRLGIDINKATRQALSTPTHNQELQRLETFYNRFSPLEPDSEDDKTSDDETNASHNSDLETQEAALVFTATALTSDPGEPQNYKQAVNGHEKKHWRPSIRGEIENFLSCDAWTKFPLMRLPKGRKPIPCKWVFKKKMEPDYTTRYKSRVVVLGFRQIPGLDYNGSFAPVASDSSIRFVLVIALYFEDEEWIIVMIDVEAAFLNAPLDNKFYITWPEGMLEEGYITQEEARTTCGECTKAMYGTVDAPRAWFRTISSFLKQNGYSQSLVDPCIFYKKQNGRLCLMAALYVDDTLLAGTPREIEQFKRIVRRKFKIQDLGEIRKHLGVRYSRGKDSHGSYLKTEMNDFRKEMVQDYEMYTEKELKKLRPLDIQERLLNHIQKIKTSLTLTAIGAFLGELCFIAAKWLLNAPTPFGSSPNVWIILRLSSGSISPDSWDTSNTHPTPVFY